MVNARSGVPRGYQAVMPYLRVRDAASAIKFYKKAFGASERYRLRMGGKVGHAELELGGSVIMISDEFPEMNAVGPKALKGTSVVLTLYVDDVDRMVAKAVKAGAKVKRAAADQFYGDRSAQIEDPFGHVWMIQSRIEKVAPQDMQKRLNTMLKAEASAAVARRAAKAPGAAKPASKGRKVAAGKARKAAGAPAVARKGRAKKAAVEKKATPKAAPKQARKSAAKKSATKTPRKSTGRRPGRPRKKAV